MFIQQFKCVSRSQVVPPLADRELVHILTRFVISL